MRGKKMIRTGLSFMLSCAVLGGVTQGSLAQGAGVIGTGQVVKSESVMARSISLNVKGDLRQALDTLLRKAGVNYIYSLRTVPGHVATVKVDNVSFEAALDAVLHAYPVEPHLVPHRLGNILSLSQVNRQHPDQKGKKYPVTMHLKNARLDTAFRSLFSTLGTDYQMDNDQSGTANLDLRDASYSQALSALMAQSPHPLRLIDRGNFLIVLPKPILPKADKNLKLRSQGKPVNP